MTQVICTRHRSCKHSSICGGAQPHEHIECEKCPIDPHATCISVTADTYSVLVNPPKEMGANDVQSLG